MQPRCRHHHARCLRMARVEPQGRTHPGPSPSPLTVGPTPNRAAHQHSPRPQAENPTPNRHSASNPPLARQIRPVPANALSNRRSLAGEVRINSMEGPLWRLRARYRGKSSKGTRCLDVPRASAARCSLRLFGVGTEQLSSPPSECISP